MQLYLKNIGKLKKANIELKGITVIAGENDTGKSTVGKVLFSVFNSYKDIENKVKKERVENIKTIIENSKSGISDFKLILSNIETDEIAKYLLTNVDKYSKKESLEKDLPQLIRKYNPAFAENTEFMDALNHSVNRIFIYLTIEDERIIDLILLKNLYSEFGNQICNYYSNNNSEIRLTIKTNVIQISMKDNIVEKTTGKLSLKTEVIYIDDPFIIDEKMIEISPNSYEHRKHLKHKLFYVIPDNVLDEIIKNEKLKKVLEKLNIVCDGEIESNKTIISYKNSKMKKGIEIKNVSTGLKTFIIIKMLLQNGALEFNGTIVLDEPEVHLHPEWQLVFAEIIVLLQKEFDMHILLNTHSPYFIEAIEVYSKKHGIADKCKYYLAENDSNNSTSEIINVTDETERIYEKLYRPLQNLENEGNSI